MRFWIAALAMFSATEARSGPGKAYEHLLCADGAACKVKTATDVARDPSGLPQAVVTVLVEPGSPDAAFPGCAPAEYWLVTGSAAKPVRRQLLASGYSGECAAVGNDAAAAAATFDFEEYVGGGHPDHYTHHNTLSLSPLGFAAEHGSDAQRLPGTNIVEYDWSWRTFSGTGSARYFRCNAAGDAISEDEPKGPLVHWATLPAIAATATGVAHLGDCAARVDGVHDGFTVYGKPSTAADSSFRAALVGSQLLVEVSDDHWVGPGKDWTYDDHLEIWLAREMSPLQLDKCEDLSGAGALQWGVRISDGAVFPGYGKPSDKLGVRVVRAAAKDGDSALLAITLPGGFDPKQSAITVVYSDSDDGRTQKRLIATSEVKMGKRWSIGRARVIEPREATCTVQGGKLEPVLNHTFTWDHALIGGGD